MKKIPVIERVKFRDKRPYVRGTHIPVELLIGLGVTEVKKMYPWLKDDQVEDALEFVKEVLDRSFDAQAKTKIQAA